MFLKTGGENRQKLRLIVTSFSGFSLSFQTLPCKKSDTCTQLFTQIKNTCWPDVKGRWTVAQKQMRTKPDKTQKGNILTKVKRKKSQLEGWIHSFFYYDVASQ